MRTGTITIAGGTFTITQEEQPCSYSLSPLEASFDLTGGTGSIGVTAPVGCEWTATKNSNWITITSDNVLSHFEERLQALKEEDVIKEADRCMSCGMCFECDNCVIYCPQGAVKRTQKSEATMGRYVYTDYGRCIGCHICAEVCPTGYIEMGMGG